MTKQDGLFDSIVGTGPYRGRYKGGVSGESELASALERLIRDADLKKLTGEQLDHLGRLLSAAKAVSWQEVLRRDGWKVRAWRAAKGHPGARHVGHGMYELRAEWIDHPFRYTGADGQPVFCSEPYGLTAGALRELAALADEGWDVDVNPCFSTHFPGCTILVKVRRRGGKDVTLK